MLGEHQKCETSYKKRSRYAALKCHSKQTMIGQDRQGAGLGSTRSHLGFWKPGTPAVLLVPYAEGKEHLHASKHYCVHSLT